MKTVILFVLAAAIMLFDAWAISTTGGMLAVVVLQ